MLHPDRPTFQDRLRSFLPLPQRRSRLVSSSIDTLHSGREEAIRTTFTPYGHVPIIIELTQPERKLGALIIPTIHTGDLVPLGRTNAIIADFDAIEPFQTDLSAAFKQFKKDFPKRFLSDPHFTKAFLSLRKSDRQVFQAALFAGDIARQFFQLHMATIDENSMHVARSLIGWDVADRTDPKSPYLKKLSESASLGVCSEIAIFGKEIMRRVGVDMDYATGYIGMLSSREHSFLTIDHGRLICDISMMIAQRDGSESFGLMIADSELNNQHDSQTYRMHPYGQGAWYRNIDINGGYSYFSCKS